MTRTLDSATEAASQSASPHTVFFVKLEFDGGDVTLCTWDSTLSFGGDDYIGAGGIGSIGAVDEDSDLSRSTLSLTLRGLPTDILSIVMNEHFQGRTATLRLGYLDPVTGQLVADPIILHRGRMDTYAVEQGETLSITLTVESRFAAWDRPLVRRYNNADQQLRYPGDRGLEFVEQTVEKPIFWGQPTP